MGCLGRHPVESNILKNCRNYPGFKIWQGGSKSIFLKNLSNFELSSTVYLYILNLKKIDIETNIELILDLLFIQYSNVETFVCVLYNKTSKHIDVRNHGSHHRGRQKWSKCSKERTQWSLDLNGESQYKLGCVVDQCVFQLSLPKGDNETRQQGV